MMSTTAKNPDSTPIPVQLSEPEFNEFIFPHLSMPKRGPKCKIGYHRRFNLILWVFYTGMQWKCLPIPKGPTGKPEIHYTNVYRAFAKWANDESLQQAFIASVAHLSEEKKLDLRVLHGDGTNTVAKKGAMTSGILAINIRRARRSWPSLTIMAMCYLPSPWLQSIRRI
jgi:transposase